MSRNVVAERGRAHQRASSMPAMCSSPVDFHKQAPGNTCTFRRSFGRRAPGNRFRSMAMKMKLVLKGITARATYIIPARVAENKSESSRRRSYKYLFNLC